MLEKIILAVSGIVFGMIAAYFILTTTDILDKGKSFSLNFNLTNTQNNSSKKNDDHSKKRVIGFLPFWLIDRAQKNYNTYINQLSYFNVVIDDDGSIQEFTSPGESDPGWHALFTGKVDDYLHEARANGVDLSLTIFSGDDKKIDNFLVNPTESANNLIRDLEPIIEKYGFTDINLDIEKVADSDEEQRKSFAEFASEFRKLLRPDITLTMDVVATSFVKETNLSNPKALAQIADYIVLMGYDFHSPSAYVTGPVAPQSGAGVINEFDIESAVQAAKTLIPTEKLILAIPLYGYGWETIGNMPRAAVMPGSAYSISSKSVEEMLVNCNNCQTMFNETDAEGYTISEDPKTGLFNQFFYPTQKSTQVKVDFAKKENIGGIALWAIGYEDDTILKPLVDYLR